MRLLKQQHGFSLLEALVAFVILALALGVLAQIFGRGTQVLTLGQSANQAVIVAESLLASAASELRGRDSARGRDGEFEWFLSGQRYDSTGLDLQQVIVEIRWQERGRSHDLTLTSLRPVQP